MFKILFVYLIRGYQFLLSPVLMVVAGTHGCKFRPTCSERTVGAIEKYGVLKGLRIGINQLRKCY